MDRNILLPSVLLQLLGFAVIFLVGCQKTPAVEETKTLNTPSVDTVPQSVALIWRGEVFCSGVVLDKRTVLTAAHCLGRFPEREIGIYFGPLGPDQPRPLHSSILVAAAEVHPRFDPSSPPPTTSDLAKLYFDRDLPLESSLELPRIDPQASLGAVQACSLVYAAGYGVGGTHPKPNKRMFSGQIVHNYPESQIVIVGHTNDSYSCPGDSGCPVFLDQGLDKRPVLVGIHKGMFTCDGVSQPMSHFTPLYPHAAWINKRSFAVPVGPTISTVTTSKHSTKNGPEGDKSVSASVIIGKKPGSEGGARPFLSGAMRAKVCGTRGGLFSKPKPDLHAKNPQVSASSLP